MSTVKYNNNKNVKPTKHIEKKKKEFPKRIVVNTYKRRMDDELDLNPGDHIHVITDDQEYNDGWYFGHNLMSNKIGLFPKNFTQIMSTTNSNGTTTATPKRKLNNKSNIVVTTTMNDIDQALRALKNDSMDLLTGGESSSTVANTSSTINHSSSSSSASDTSSSNNYNNNTNNNMSEYHFDTNNVKHWSPNKVAQYFIKIISIDIPTAKLFEKHKINGTILLQLELLHLKEIEINSFGTRFIIFKAIEQLRKLNNNNNKDNIPSPLPSSSSNLLPAAITLPTSKINLARSTSVNGTHSTIKETSEKLAGLAISSNQHIFESPGTAPKPPSYPSPVQPKLSPANTPKFSSPSINNKYSFPREIKSSNTNITKSTLTIPTSTSSFSSVPTTASSPLPITTSTSSRTPRSKMNYKQNYYQQQQPSSHDHHPSIYSNHKKSVSGGSFIDLFSRISTMSPSKNDLLEGDEDATNNNSSVSNVNSIMLERPKSVIYSHSRSSSGIPQHMRKSSQGLLDIKKHRRASSVLSFFSPGKSDYQDHDSVIYLNNNTFNNPTLSHSRKSSVVNSPLKQELKETLRTPKDKKYRHSMFVSNSVTPTTMISNGKIEESTTKKIVTTPTTHMGKRPKSELSSSKNKAKQILRFNNNNTNSKKNTTAFLEGIRHITVDEAIKNATCYGWMHKKSSGAMGTWKKRFFILHGTRLSYFGSINDTKERGLIDITGHRVVPVKDEDKLIALYAASTRSGKYIFKLLPPQPGSRKGLTFTQPKVHYFAVDSKEDIKNWLSALIKASIDIDDTVPVVSSYAMPTISLSEAKQMLKDAKQELILREQDELEDDEGKRIWEQQHKSPRYLSSNML